MKKQIKMKMKMPTNNSSENMRECLRWNFVFEKVRIF